ncbi:30S ribosomal protein S18 [Halobacteriovorax sp. GB3]|uniref:30S ribosomal protein S18 n=1 Tax=Halobacteriovorax sp. GB3 TaxID=2719615 RepID=UPI00235FF9DA|nr:30S ribosomal protein S18 [Halobacteriovorax sp. GB3]MDD0853868.1 30S ribosomal protein S18 [Halobacteriovorax sp. GB3]
MIYELALVAKSNLGEEGIKALQTMVEEVAKSFDGEVLLSDDWGNKTFAQATSKGVKTGHYLYFIYTGNAEANVELNRKFKINEDILKTMIVKLSDVAADGEALVKKFKSPFSKNHNGSVLDDLDQDSDAEKDRKKFARRKNCWFTAKSIKADWKDPKTFNWLINEFGKISPARVSGVSRKHQRFAQAAIKRARNIGVVSHMRSTFSE